MRPMAGGNIDGVRLRIMDLEDAEYFDAMAWSRVLADLEAAGRISALEDAKRRMETARQNQAFVGWDVGSGQDLTVEFVITANVSAETEA